jgi:hypothetical protein
MMSLLFTKKPVANAASYNAVVMTVLFLIFAVVLIGKGLAGI